MISVHMCVYSPTCVRVRARVCACGMILYTANNLHYQCLCLGKFLLASKVTLLLGFTKGYSMTLQNNSK